jgi:aminotransferase
VHTTAANGFRLNGRMLEEKVTSRTRALIINFPTNPTGAMLTPDDVRSIAKFAVKHDLIVITDEIYDTLAYDRTQFSIASLPGMKERTIYLNGFSKAYAMTGFRIGYSCAPAPITDAMMKIHQYTMLCAPILSQKAAIEALNKGQPEMLAMREEYRRRRNFIHAALNDAGLKCHKPAGAFYAFPRIPECGMTSKEFALALLDKENVACVPGTAFGSCGEGFIRCSYATAMSDIQEAAIRIKRFVAKLKK